jgi:hypothetical protein
VLAAFCVLVFGKEVCSWFDQKKAHLPGLGLEVSLIADFGLILIGNVALTIGG